MTPKEKYSLINTILWCLKFPEVVVTIVIIAGLIGAVIGLCSYYIPLYVIVARLTMFVLRLIIINEKRNLERTNPKLKNSVKHYIDPSEWEMFRK